MSESPLNFKLQQERIKNLQLENQNSFFKKIIQRILEMPCIPQKSKWEAARTIQLAHKLETNETPIKNRSLPKKRVSLEGNEGEYGRNKRNYDRLGKSLQERARLNTIVWYFLQGEIILGVLEIPCTLQKPKWAAARTIQLAQKLEKMKNLSKPNASQKNVLWREMKGIWEKEGKTWKARKTTIAKS